MARIHLLRLIAIVPVLVAAIVNTGYQYLVAVGLNGGAGTGDWRERVAGFLKVDHSDPGAYDILVAGLVHLLPVFAMAFLTVGLWERVFSHKRNLRFDVGVIYTALLFSLMMPPGVSFFSIVFGMSFAMVFAHGIFGGEGKAFLNPALVGVAVIQISFPSALVDHPLWVNLNGYAGTRFFSFYHQQGTDGLAWVGTNWWDAIPKPDASNTGPSDPSILSSGNAPPDTITQDGATYENFTKTGNITIDADNVTLRNFRIAAVPTFTGRFS